MTFDSVDALKSYILSRMQPAVQKAQEQVYQVIDRFVKEYYAEFSPEVYERTYQLYRSLVKSDIKSTGNGYEACVYFDIGALDYAMKTIGVGKDGVDALKKSIDSLYNILQVLIIIKHRLVRKRKISKNFKMKKPTYLLPFRMV